MDIAYVSLDEVNDDSELLKRIITNVKTWVYNLFSEQTQ